MKRSQWYVLGIAFIIIASSSYSFMNYSLELSSFIFPITSGFIFQDPLSPQSAAQDSFTNTQYLASQIINARASVFYLATIVFFFAGISFLVNGWLEGRVKH